MNTLKIANYRLVAIASVVIASLQYMEYHYRKASERMEIANPQDMSSMQPEGHEPADPTTSITTLSAGKTDYVWPTVLFTSGIIVGISLSIADASRLRRSSPIRIPLLLHQKLISTSSPRRRGRQSGWHEHCIIFHVFRLLRPTLLSQHGSCKIQSHQRASSNSFANPTSSAQYRRGHIPENPPGVGGRAQCQNL